MKLLRQWFRAWIEDKWRNQKIRLRCRHAGGVFPDAVFYVKRHESFVKMDRSFFLDAEGWTGGPFYAIDQSGECDGETVVFLQSAPADGKTI